MSSKSRHLVDPELLCLLDGWPYIPAGPDMVQQLRSRPAISMDVPFNATESAVKVSTKLIRGPKGAPDVSVRLYQPPKLQGAVGAIFHIHGGGFVCGKAVEDDPMHRRLTAGLECVLAAVDYRLAPETKFPGNIEDCYAALTWFFEVATTLNVDPKRIGVMGESAGGGLAAALALLARDRGEFKLAFQHLIYPMLDDRTCIAVNPNPFAGEYIWTAPKNQIGWSALLGVPPGSKDISPYAAAARAENLTALPPTFMATAALDLFVDENIDYARRLIRQGVPVELHVYPRAFHGFDFDQTARVAADARRDSLVALARFLGHEVRIK